MKRTLMLLPFFAALMSAQTQTKSRTETQTTTTTLTQSVDQPQVEESFDVKMKDDRGKLIVGPRDIRFEDVSNAKRSRTWTYAQIKEFHRDGSKELKIRPYEGDDVELRLEGKELTEAVYKNISDRIVTARGR